MQLEKHVCFLRANILAVIPTEDFSPSGGTCFSGFRDFDFVVSNPPYVGFTEADKVQKSVFKFEPRMAVFAGENGLDVICPLIEQAHQALKPGGWLALEIGYSMRDAVVNLLSPTVWDDIRVVPDLQGIPRVVAAKKRVTRAKLHQSSQTEPFDSPRTQIRWQLQRVMSLTQALSGNQCVVRTDDLAGSCCSSALIAPAIRASCSSKRKTSIGPRRNISQRCAHFRRDGNSCESPYQSSHRTSDETRIAAVPCRTPVPVAVLTAF